MRIVDLVGTWALVAVSAHAGERVVDDPYGSSPQGLLSYTRGGRMAAIVSYSDRTTLSGDRVSAPIDERAAAFSTFFSYAGRYSLTGDRVVHHVEISSVQNWVGTDLVRIIESNGELLTLCTPPLSVGEEVRVTRLTWQRLER